MLVTAFTGTNLYPDGRPLAGGYIEVLAVPYADADLTVPLSNPVPLDSLGVGPAIFVPNAATTVKLYSAGGELLSTVVQPAQEPPPVSWTENFVEGLTPYVTHIGNRALNTISTGPYGQQLDIASQSSGTVSGIKRTRPLITEWWEFIFYFRLNALNSDDGSFVQLVRYSDMSPIFTFTSTREGFADSLRRPRGFYVPIAGGSSVQQPLWSSSPVIGRWYQGRLWRDSSVRFTLTDLTFGTQVTTSFGAYVSTYAPISGLYFYSDSGLPTSPTSYADISLTAPGVQPPPITPFSTPQVLDSGRPNAGGKVFTYLPGSFSQKATTYLDSGRTVLAPNPLILDETGSNNTPVYLVAGTAVNFVQTKPDGTTVIAVLDHAEVPA